jgi:metal-responsive CopG/Arc/MetJ family transcriptional regulator
MKTAISLPDKVFHEAEQLARQQGISRSELYKKAIEKYLEEEKSKETLLEKLNRVYGEVDSSLDPFMKEVVRRTFERNEWEE